MDWKKFSWKGARAALAGLGVLVLYGAVEAFLNATDTAAELGELGLPALLIPVALGIGAAARNWLKHRKSVAA